MSPSHTGPIQLPPRQPGGDKGPHRSHRSSHGISQSLNWSPGSHRLRANTGANFTNSVSYNLRFPQEGWVIHLDGVLCLLTQQHPPPPGEWLPAQSPPLSTPSSPGTDCTAPGWGTATKALGPPQPSSNPHKSPCLPSCPSLLVPNPPVLPTGSSCCSWSSGRGSSHWEPSHHLAAPWSVKFHTG